jgi:xanthine dehydrogenase molybdopterin-binding subunit B
MVDIGQVEGGFIMGTSFLSLEDLEGVFGPDGKERKNEE